MCCTYRILNDKLFYKQLSFNAEISILGAIILGLLVNEYDRFLVDIWRNKMK